MTWLKPAGEPHVATTVAGQAARYVCPGASAPVVVVVVVVKQAAACKSATPGLRQRRATLSTAGATAQAPRESRRRRCRSWCWLRRRRRRVVLCFQLRRPALRTRATHAAPHAHRSSSAAPGHRWKPCLSSTLSVNGPQVARPPANTRSRPRPPPRHFAVFRVRQPPCAPLSVPPHPMATTACPPTTGSPTPHRTPAPTSEALPPAAPPGLTCN